MMYCSTWAVCLLEAKLTVCALPTLSSLYHTAVNYLLGKIFYTFRSLFSWTKFLSCEHLSCINDYIEPVATFTTWEKIYSTEYFCNAKVHVHVHVVGMGKIYCYVFDSSGRYCRVGNFWGRKLSWSLQFESNPQKYFHQEILCVPHPPTCTCTYMMFSILQKFSLWNPHFLLICEEFSPSKYSSY